MNASTGFVFTKPGFLSLLQDGGRRGVMHMGLATGGVMDRHAWAWGNRLLDNPWGTPALEITFGGIEFQSELDTQIAVTGAEVDCSINGRRCPLWSTLNVRAGDTVTLGTPRAGLRAYLAVRGGFEVSPGLGNSCSTFTREGLGGLNNLGQPLQAGDRLPCPAGLPPAPLRKVPTSWQPDYRQPLELAVLLCAQVDRFPAAALSTFFQSSYTLTPQTDRMGARLKGPPLDVLGKQLISEGISLGAIQVPADGQPILLLNDRQTIGGYPKLGAVTPRSLDALAQRPPGTRVRFRATTLHEAQQQERQFLAFFTNAPAPGRH